MAALDRVFAGGIPELYDRLLVPLIFRGYAEDLAERIAATGPSDVLETAAGTGALTRALAAHLPTTTRIVATDLNQPMIDRALAHPGSRERVEWLTADATALAFQDGAFDTVACQFGVMFFPDKVRGYQEARRVLRPGGHYFFNVWDKIAANDFARTTTEVLADMFPDDPPLFMARTPHGYHDSALIRAQLESAGFGTVAIETVERTSHGTSPIEVATAYCQGTPFRGEIESRAPAGLEEATRRVADVLARRFGGGAIEGRIRAHILHAVR